ncbi:hypothetical protein H9L39_09656 [Fusarium oxysporum f. sp. albedinis]|nr:hypothetical protein H9L39_09656 [Fusarium oxysporum f. sp. albedinis]
MTNAPGRPSKACYICKRQKIRCPGERPSCGRCVRLKNTSLVYHYIRKCYYRASDRRDHYPRCRPLLRSLRT